MAKREPGADCRSARKWRVRGDGATLPAPGIFLVRAQAFAGDRFGVAQQFAQRPGSDDFTAVNPRARAEVNDVIGAAHGFFIVFHDENGVAAVLELLQRG